MTRTPNISPNPRAVIEDGNVAYVQHRGKRAVGHYSHAVIDAEDAPFVGLHNFYVSWAGESQYSSMNGDPHYYSKTSATREDGRPTKMFLHQIVDEHKHGCPCPDGYVVDHKNDDTMDNRKINLERVLDPVNLNKGRKRKQRRYNLKLPMAA